MTLPFLMVYFHAVRHLDLGVAGAAVSSLALAGLVGNPLGGAWCDRVGPRPVLALGWGVAAAGSVGIAAVTTTWQAFAASVLTGFGAALAWPALDALLGRLAPADKRSSTFALRHATMNTGLGVGAVAASLIVATASTSHFVALYVADAASFLVAAALLLALPGRAERSPRTLIAGRAARRHDAKPSVPAGADDDGPTAKRGYRAVLADAKFRRLWLLIAILVGVGFAQITTSFPVLAIGAGADAWVVAVAFAANTITVTICQLPMLRFAAGRRRTSAVAVLCVLWMVSWAMVAVGGLGGPGQAAVLFIGAAAVFGVGETLFSPTLPPLVNDIAPEELRGRYNGGSAFAFTVGFAAGPAFAGLLLAHHLRAPLLGILIVALGVAGVIALDTRRRIPPEVDVIDDPSPARRRRGRTGCRAVGPGGRAMTAATPPPNPAPSEDEVLWPDEFVDLLNAALAALDGGDPHTAADLAVRAEALAADISPVALANAVLLSGMAAQESGTADDQAVACYDRVAALTRPALADADPDAAGLFASAGAELAALHRARGRFRQAQDAATETLGALAPSGAGSVTELARLHNEIGMAGKYGGDFARAEQAYDAALTLLQTELPADHPDLATIWHNIGGLAHARGDYAAAEAPARRAAEIRARCPRARPPRRRRRPRRPGPDPPGAGPGRGSRVAAAPGARRLRERIRPRPPGPRRRHGEPGGRRPPARRLGLRRDSLPRGARRPDRDRRPGPPRPRPDPGQSGRPAPRDRSPGRGRGAGVPRPHHPRRRRAVRSSDPDGAGREAQLTRHTRPEPQSPRQTDAAVHADTYDGSAGCFEVAGRQILCRSGGPSHPVRTTSQSVTI